MIKVDMQKTGIPCFECGWHSGIDCPGRKPDEATRCVLCMVKFMQKHKEINNWEESTRQQEGVV